MVTRLQHAFVITVLVVSSLLPATKAMAAECPPTHGKVSRAMFTTKVVNREPVDQVLILDDKYREVYFFSELLNLEGQHITHRWEHDGKVMLQKTFDVKGPRWRVSSSMVLNSSMLGRWTVIVTTEDGCPIKAAVFTYVASNGKGQGSAILKLK